MNAIRALFAALSFLTIFPVPDSWTGREAGLSRSSWWFPVVGALLGGIAAAACYGLLLIMPQLAAGAIVVCLLVALSRGLHMDGLADTADGLLSTRSREQMLAIMRDSRIGAMGVLAVAGVLVLKTAFLASAASSAVLWKTVFLTPVVGRCAVMLVMSLFPYARSDGGLATLFQVHRGARAVLALWGVVAALAAGGSVLGGPGLVAAVASLGVALLFGWYCRWRLGGYTGDVLGAASEIAECVPIMVVAVWGVS